MRVLIAYETAYVSYASAFGTLLRALRSGAEIRVVGLGDLRADIARFSPHLVISSLPTGAAGPGEAAWFMLSPDPTRPSEARLGDGVWSATNPDLEEMLAVVDAAGALARARLPLRDAPAL